MPSLSDMNLTICNTSPAYKEMPAGYIIQVSIANSTQKWFVCRRYSEFRKFWHHLAHVLTEKAEWYCSDRRHFLLGIELKQFPARWPWWAIRKSAFVVARRRDILDGLLQGIALRLQTCDRTRLLECEAHGCAITRLLRKFFAFPETIHTVLIENELSNGASCPDILPAVNCKESVKLPIDISYLKSYGKHSDAGNTWKTASMSSTEGSTPRLRSINYFKIQKFSMQA